MRGERGIALDLEGPTVDLEREGHHAGHLRAAEETVGLVLTLEEAIKDLPHFLGGPDEAVARDIWKLAGSKKSSPEEIFASLSAHFNSWVESVVVIPTRPGLFEFLEETRSRQVPIAIGTSTERRTAMSYIQRTALQDYFDAEHIITATPGIRTKPEPDIYLETARVMQVNPRNQFVFEDSARGVKAGVAAGSIVIGLPIYYQQTRDVLKNAGAAFVESGWEQVDLDYLLSGYYSLPNGQTFAAI